MIRAAFVAGALALSALAAGVAQPAGAADECRGLPVCLPVEGPWVVVPAGQDAQWQLRCPRRGYIVAGTDARVADPATDVSFRAETGSPVAPGVATRSSALFTAVSTRARPGPTTFRPFIGCVPVQGGGSRSQTVHTAVRPTEPVDRRVTTVRLVPGVERLVVARCAPGGRLLDAAHAAGFRTSEEPDDALLGLVGLRRAVRGSSVIVRARLADDVPRGLRVEVQAHAVCTKGRR